MEKQLKDGNLILAQKFLSSNDFLNTTLKLKTIKDKIGRCDYIKISNYCTEKDNIKRRKDKLHMERKI